MRLFVMCSTAWYTHTGVGHDGSAISFWNISSTDYLYTHLCSEWVSVCLCVCVCARMHACICLMCVYACMCIVFVYVYMSAYNMQRAMCLLPLSADLLKMFVARLRNSCFMSHFIFVMFQTEEPYLVLYSRVLRYLSSLSVVLVMVRSGTVLCVC